jgi:AmmeMemoRadiSam system protein B
LDKQLQGWLDQVKKEREKQSQADEKGAPHVRAIISPHAGYAYSGSTAAHAFSRIDPSKIKRIFILGPSHAYRTATCHVTTAHVYETPIGDLQVDREVIAELRKHTAFKEMSLAVDENEHSLELQLPYIAKIMANRSFTVVPVMVGALSNDSEKMFGEIFAPYLAAEENLFVISSDFCHWGDRFDYQPCPSASSTPIWKHIHALDHEGMSLIAAQHYDGFKAYLRKTHNTICGRHPIGVFLQALGQCKTQFKVDFVSYTQSSQCLSLADSSVSYCAGICVPKVPQE